MDELFTADRKTKLIATQIEVDLRRWIQKEILSKKKFNELVDTDIFNQCFNYCVKRKKSLNELVDENLIHDNELLEFISFITSQLLRTSADSSLIGNVIVVGCCKIMGEGVDKLPK